MKYFSTFSGIGGFELGIEQAYEQLETLCNEPEIAELQSQRDMPSNNGNLLQRATCIGFSEIDKYAKQIYQSHFPDHQDYGDITKINADELPDFDLLVGGFPCQAFSIAGKRRGFEDTRGTLFFELARILRAKRPRLFLFENVKGLLSHDNGQTFRTIIATLDELGYDLQWQVLNSKNHGVPQNRERIFIVGHLRGTSRPEVFPLEENCSEDIVLPTITTRITADSNGTYVGKRQEYKETESSGQDNGQEWVKSNDSDIERGETYSSNIRRLTPTECERLQGFPDDWTKLEIEQTSKIKRFLGIKKYISDSQRYKCLGNAVTVNVIRDIMSKLLDKSKQPSII